MNSINLFDLETCSGPSSEFDPDLRQFTHLRNLTPSDDGYLDANAYIDIEKKYVFIGSYNVKVSFLFVFTKH